MAELQITNHMDFLYHIDHVTELFERFFFLYNWPEVVVALSSIVIKRMTAYLIYRKVSNIRRTKCQNLNESRLALQLSVPNPLKPSVKSIMKM